METCYSSNIFMKLINFSCLNTPMGQKYPNTPKLYTTCLDEKVIIYVHNCIKYFTKKMTKRRKNIAKLRFTNTLKGNAK